MAGEVELRSPWPAGSSSHGRRGRAPIPLAGGIELPLAGGVELRSHGQLGLAPLQMAGHVPRRRRLPLFLEIDLLLREVDTELVERLLATDNAGAVLESAGSGARRRRLQLWRRAGRGAELLHLQLEPAGVALLAGDGVLGADGGEGAADREARQQEVAMGISGGMGKEESVG